MVWFRVPHGAASKMLARVSIIHGLIGKGSISKMINSCGWWQKPPFLLAIERRLRFLIVCWQETSVIRFTSVPFGLFMCSHNMATGFLQAWEEGDGKDGKMTNHTRKIYRQFGLEDWQKRLMKNKLNKLGNYWFPLLVGNIANINIAFKIHMVQDLAPS